MLILAMLVAGIWYYLILPQKLFVVPYSTVLSSREGILLSASIANDGQWRFPQGSHVPDKFTSAIIAFEDKRFFSHPGVDPLAFARAVKQNIAAGKIVSGGSTLTMQVVRLARKNRQRTFFEKFYEVILATRLELSFSKSEILSMYAAHAPFGTNVVGVETACWRYFKTDVDDLSWGQAALLAVLPNAPSLIHPGKNRTVLRVKRDRLLDLMRELGTIDSLTAELAKTEPIPVAPEPLPRNARHLLETMRTHGSSGQKIKSTLQHDLQIRVEQVVNEYYHHRLKGMMVHNAAVLVLDVRSGDVLAYAGNVTGESGYENEVDLIQARRSTGSILKPFLYAAMLDEGKILPRTLLPDVPFILAGFTPKNFSLQYDGAIHADEALIRSLNVPAVHLLKEYRYERFHKLLGNLGMTTLSQGPDHYGLSLILGGAEGTLWDLTGMYASMGRTVHRYFDRPGSNRYRRSDFHSPRIQSFANESTSLSTTSWLSASSIFTTLNVLTEVYRPGEESGWRHFTNSKKIAWKTGTSFGFRDGWAIGLTGDYAVGVWVGNADGEGRPGLTGTDAAAPLMFSVFGLLPNSTWYDKPVSEMSVISVCRKSGLRISSYCDEIDSMEVVSSGLSSAVCLYHKNIHLSPDRKFRVTDACMNPSQMQHMPWFVLPPMMEYYYKKVERNYKTLPPFMSGCIAGAGEVSMDILYPKSDSRVYLPVELGGEKGTTVFQAVHRDKNISVHWHIDGQYICTTGRDHKVALKPSPGPHILTIVDDLGNSMQRKFEVIAGVND